MRLCVCEAPKGAVSSHHFFRAETLRSSVEARKKWLGIAAFGALFPTTTIVGKRRRRSAHFGNETALEQQAMLLHEYMDSLEWAGQPEVSLQKDMVAKYLECGAGEQYDSPSLHGCLQKLSCIVYDDSITINESEREVANM